MSAFPCDFRTEMVNHECRCTFDLPYTEWPVPGTPAHVVVMRVDMPMIKMRARSDDDSRGFWINASLIKTISRI